MDNLWFQIFFGIASIYFGAQTLRIFPAFLRLLVALLSGMVKWPGPRIHDPNPSAGTVRERLGVGYENLFSTFVWNASSVIAAFVFSILTYLSNTPLLRGYVQIKSPWQFLILSLIALVGGRLALVKAIHNKAQVIALLSDLAKKVEPRGIDGQSAEAEYAIEHPLIGKQSQKLNNTRALDLFFESVRCHQDGNEQKASSLYQEAMEVDPSLHTHARDTLSNMTQSCSPNDGGPIYYWLGIHSEYLADYQQAAIWYEKAIDTFNKIGYQKRESRAHCNLGNVKMRLRDPSAMEEFEKAITLDPKNGIAHINIGIAYYRISDPGDNRYDRALDAFADAIVADPCTYGPIVISHLRSIGYTWKEDLEKIGQRIAKKQGIDLDTLTAGEREDILQANHYFDIGNGFFESGRYKEALEQFEKGKLLTNKFPGNFLGVSMTAMQMIELGAIPKDQIPFYLEKAERNIDECLRIAPTHLDYLSAKNIIRDYKKKYHVE